jgi:hypothetical protein
LATDTLMKIQQLVATILNTDLEFHMTEEEQSEQIKETFAYFGRAFYMATVVETGLAHVLLQAEFMKSIHEEYVRTKGKGFDRKQYEADFDAFMERNFAQTMGNLVKRVQKSADFSEDLKTRIIAAKERRDFLVHHYWRVMAARFYNSDGRAEMIEELNADTELFEKLDEDIQAAMKPARQKLGINEDKVAASVREFMARVESGEEPE